MVDAFEKKQDVYKIMAAAIYHKPIEKISKEERFVGKTTILGAGYGMGPKKFQAQLKNFGVQVELEEAERIIRTYREQYPRIVNLWKVAHEFVLRAILNDQWVAFGRNEVLSVDGALGIHLPNGLRIKYPNLREELANVDPRDGPHAFQIVYDTKRGKQTLTTKIYGGKVVENVCQALARIIIGEQMLKIAKKYRVVMTVHDAIACIAPKEEAETAKEYVELCMRLRPNWALALPLDCEAGYGESYGDC